MVNKVFLLGRLGKDPEKSTFSNEKVVLHFSIATNEIFKDKNGNKVEQTDWHQIEMWDSLALNAEKVLKKGKLVFIEGKIKYDTWKDKEGKEKHSLKIRALQFQVINSGNSNNTNPNEVGLNTDEIDSFL